jgi:hypothetical protein
MREPNPAASVDAPTARLFAFQGLRRRATERHRSPVTGLGPG